MAHDTDSMNMTNFVTTCQKISNKRAAISRETKNNSTSASTRNTFPRPAAATTAASAPAPPSTATGTDAGPMDLSSNCKKLSPEERTQRMAQERCLYCGGLNHMARNYPVARRPLLTAETHMDPNDKPADKESENQMSHTSRMALLWDVKLLICKFLVLLLDTSILKRRNWTEIILYYLVV